MCDFIVSRNHGSHDMNPCHVTLAHLGCKNKVSAPVGLSLSCWQHLALTAIAVQVSVLLTCCQILQLVLEQCSGSACSGVGATVTVQVLVLQYRLCVQVSSAVDYTIQTSCTVVYTVQ